MLPAKNVVIVVPAYNAAATVRETLDSIQQQQGCLERVACVRLADDGSSDDTAAVAGACWTSAVPLKISRNVSNQGERGTMNEAVESLPPEIEWFFILHADDLAKPDWLEVMLRGIDEAPPSTASFTASYDVLFPDGRIRQGENFGEARKVVIEGTPASVRDTLKRGCWFKISSCALRVAAFRRLGGFRPDMPQLGDWEFVLRLLRDGWTIEYLPLCLSVYRQGEQSVSSRSFREHRDVKEALVILEGFRDFLSYRELIGRHVYYLGTLARRSAASLLRREPDRLRRAIGLSVRVIAALCKNVFLKGSV